MNFSETRASHKYGIVDVFHNEALPAFPLYTIRPIFF